MIFPVPDIPSRLITKVVWSSLEATVASEQVDEILNPLQLKMSDILYVGQLNEEIS